MLADKSLQSCRLCATPETAARQAPRPWDSPGKNTGVGCRFLLQCIKVKVKSLSHVQLLATPWTAAHQAPPSLGFSRLEYWSGLPFPSPMHKSESEVIQSSPTLCDPMDWSPPGSSVHGICQAKSTGVGCHCLLWLVGLALSYSVKPPQPGNLGGPVIRSIAIIRIRDRGQGW